MTQTQLEAVVLAELEKLYRVASRMTLDPTKAEDLVGQTLMIGFKNAHQCDGVHPVAWLIKIMNHQFLHDRRRKQPEVHIEDAGDEHLDPQAHYQLLATVHQLDILEALDLLPEEYRLAVALCDMEELSYNEAARALEVPVGTVRSRLSRGRRMLQKKLAGWELNR